MNKMNKYIHISVRDDTGEAVWNVTEVANRGVTIDVTWNATEVGTWGTTRTDIYNSLKGICYG